MKSALTTGLGLVLMASAWAGDLERLDNGDGTYSYAEALAYDGPTSIQRGALQLELVDPARYPWTPTLVGWDGEPRWDEGGYSPGELDDPVGSVVGGTVVLDDLKWKIIDIDRSILHDRVVEYNSMLDEEELEGTDDLLKPGEIDPTELWDPQTCQSSEPGWTEFQSQYTPYVCGSRRKYVWEHGREWVAQTAIPSDVTDHLLRPVVYVSLDTDEDGMDDFTCTGVLFDDTHVLTAAHCVLAEGEHVDVDPELFHVEQLYGYTGSVRSGVLEVNPHPRFRGIGNARDFAVLTLEEPLGAGGYYMGLSRASDTTLRDIEENRLLGIPSIGLGDEESCDLNWRIHRSEQGQLYRLHRRTGSWDLTHATGYSGGAHYYDGMTQGGRRYIIAVHSASFTNALLRRSARGPKVAFWRETILSLAE